MKRFKNVILSCFLLILGICWISPVYIVFINSFKNRAELYENILAFPKEFSLEYYEKTTEKMEFMKVLGNSLFVTIVSTVLIIILSSMTAWMLVRNNNKISKIIFNVFVATMLIPFQTLMMPLLQEMGWFTNMGIPMIDSLGGLIFMNIGFGAGMAVFLYHGFIKSVPVALEEAARIDGCTPWGEFWRIVFPIIKPTTVTVAILDVIWL